ncbi:hypothetical protein [Alicyclobacillus acidoterrestris]|uniref:Uncharacterized protein n=1 Tax=Alicyclobacillus acidoterrestris (strain ATCC 49025 / DSM 3922 / CIP 106132 / NCIMB 13137 / GD3B) TaxID=1356854 RepID=T0BYB6_ALIAG|nr:hypothetical protein [Alicyclobacillus acidoterrestris]EPZ49043.1 hypothetical protein N007_04175 [Alicyclobacillus acidoterrestris ATCC 49025]UNO47564.1 hypothetical protein K1I37_12735 [Alicyclobacillus acidoterrestris]
MYHFPKVKMLRGELKRSEVRNSVKYQLTTKEFIQQRGQTTFRIALDNIIGFVECDDLEFSQHVNRLSSGRSDAGRAYKIVTSVLHLVSPSGVVERGQVSFYTRLSRPFAQLLEDYLQSSSQI